MGRRAQSERGNMKENPTFHREVKLLLLEERGYDTVAKRREKTREKEDEDEVEKGKFISRIILLMTQPSTPPQHERQWDGRRFV